MREVGACKYRHQRLRDLRQLLKARAPSRLGCGVRLFNELLLHLGTIGTALGPCYRIGIDESKILFVNVA